MAKTENNSRNTNEQDNRLDKLIDQEVISASRTRKAALIKEALLQWDFSMKGATDNEEKRRATTVFRDTLESIEQQSDDESTLSVSYNKLAQDLFRKNFTQLKPEQKNKVQLSFLENLYNQIAIPFYEKKFTKLNTSDKQYLLSRMALVLKVNTIGVNGQILTDKQLKAKIDAALIMRFQSSKKSETSLLKEAKSRLVSTVKELEIALLKEQLQAIIIARTHAIVLELKKPRIDLLAIDSIIKQSSDEVKSLFQSIADDPVNHVNLIRIYQECLTAIEPAVAEKYQQVMERFIQEKTKQTEDAVVEREGNSILFIGNNVEKDNRSRFAQGHYTRGEFKIVVVEEQVSNSGTSSQEVYGELTRQYNIRNGVASLQQGDVCSMELHGSQNNFNIPVVFKGQGGRDGNTIVMLRCHTSNEDALRVLIESQQEGSELAPSIVFFPNQKVLIDLDHGTASSSNTDLPAHILQDHGAIISLRPAQSKDSIAGKLEINDTGGSIVVGSKSKEQQQKALEIYEKKTEGFSRKHLETPKATVFLDKDFVQFACQKRREHEQRSSSSLFHERMTQSTATLDSGVTLATSRSFSRTLQIAQRTP